MPRASRVLSETQVYHIMIRGVNKQEIFLDNDDKAVFISLLKKVKEKFDFNIYAYVLMNNHIHLEIKDNENCISKIIHKLTTSYALYFNCVPVPAFFSPAVLYTYTVPYGFPPCK